ncbi:PstA family ABC transporter permease [Papillibacter cinnamivorans]|uniref:Phosphate transport system permease protein n=1 Tax=Papillibacter cinnamivorans DSM 12816 TaxID=1122930 RepID=A0A1W1YNM3_9FIRM|nr:ABC transporter permease subunit [Papillibacter cinnamivorans]SMC37767.1 phosphate transport system permease protein [Papillibacter cinnamivorans DSM 12816]
MPTKHKTHRADTAAGTLYAWLSTLLVAAVCLLILAVVLYYGFGELSPDFLIKEPNPSAIHTEAGGILTPLVGTVLLTAIGTAIAYPFSLATAVYLTYYARRGAMKAVIDTAIDILSGVPSVVIALFALAIFTQPWLSFFSSQVETAVGVSRAYGKSFLVSGIAMAVMILPFVIKSMEEAMKTVPASYLEGSLALGASRWRTVSRIALLASKPGIQTGVILGMGRIIGDTAIVWLTLGGTLRMTGLQPWYSPVNWMSTLRNTGSTLTTYIFFTSPAGEGNNFHVAFGAACVLIAIIVILNLLTAVVGGIGRGRRDVH